MKAGLSTKILALGLCAALAVNGNVWSFAAEAVGISKEADENAPATQSEEVVNEGGESSQESTGGESGQTDDGSSDSGQDSENSGSEDGKGGGTEGTEETPSVPEGGDGTGTGDGSDETGDGSGETGDGTETGDGSEETGDGTETGDGSEETGDGTETGDGSEETGDGTETGDGSEETGDGSETGDGNVSDNNPSDGDENGNEDNDGSDVSGNDGQDDEKEDVSGNDPSEGVSDNGVSDNGVSDNGTLGERRLRMEKVLEDGTKVIVYYSETDEALKDSELEVIPITEGEDYDKIAEQIAAAGSDASEFHSYDIYFTKDGEEVEPDEEVEVIFEFPDGGIEVSTGEEETEEAEGLSVTVGDVQPKRMMAASLDESEEEKQQEEKIKVYHFEDGIEQAPVSMESEIKENDGKVTSVSFNTESFSIYVIVTPDKSKNFSITIKDIADEDNTLDFDFEEINLITDKEVDLTDLTKNKENGGWENLATFDADGKEYKFSYATIETWRGESRITGIRCISKSILGYQYYQVQYKTDSFQEWLDVDNHKITFYYAKELKPLENIPSSKEKGISMTLFDYDGGGDDSGNPNGIQQKVMGGEDYNSEVTSEILSNTFGDDDYPSVEKNKPDNAEPFSVLFGGKESTQVESWDTDYLLQYNEETGYYSYSSFQNYAYFEETGEGEGRFLLYDALATPDNSDSDYFRRGNFFPLNELTGKFSDNTNDYDKYGNPLKPGDENQGERLYLVENPNFNFGLHMNAKFSQPKDGKIKDQAMVYEFTGDDDLWIYIDGVLVLDMGGIHDARNGRIDFETGEVEIDKVRDKEDPYKTTIREMFEKALGDEFNENDFSGNTFANFTNHTIDMFYMERGAGASNLEMKFNLPIIPADTVIVEKQLGNTDKDKYANVEFEFQLYVQEQVPDSDDEFVDGKYILYTKEMAEENGVKHILADGREDPNGLAWRTNDEGKQVFVLKCDEEAEFQNLLANREYKVVECGVKTDEYDTIEITDTETIDWGEGGAIGGTKDAESSIMTVDERGRIVFVNHCSAANSRELWIEKKMAEGQDSDGETFKIHLDLESTNGELVPYVGDYYIVEGNPIPTNDGTIELQAGQTAKIAGVLSGTKFQVYEEIDPSSQFSSDYEIEFFKGTIGSEEFESGAPHIDEDFNGADTATGEILLGNNSKVIVTNSRKGGKLAITKAIDEFKAEEDKDTRQFDFKITPLLGDTSGKDEAALNGMDYREVQELIGGGESINN